MRPALFVYGAAGPVYVIGMVEGRFRAAVAGPGGHWRLYGRGATALAAVADAAEQAALLYGIGIDPYAFGDPDVLPEREGKVICHGRWEPCCCPKCRARAAVADGDSSLAGMAGDVDVH